MKTIYLFFVITILSSCSESKKSSISIINYSNKKIEYAVLKIYKEKYSFTNLNQNDSTTIYYKVYSDADYSLNVRFSNNKIISTNVGYITHGFVFNDKILVTNNNVIFVPKIISSYNAQ